MRFLRALSAAQNCASGELVIAPAAVLYITETAPLRRSKTEIKLFHIGMITERIGGVIENNRPLSRT